MKQILFIVLTVSILFVFSCKKENTKPADDPKSKDTIPKIDTTPVIDYEMLRITKPLWKIYRVDASGTNIWKLPGSITGIEDCLKDDTYRFYKDFKLTTYENADVCSGNGDSILSTWKFVDKKKRLVTDLIGPSDTADILLLTDSTMNLFLNYMGTEATVFFKKK